MTDSLAPPTDSRSLLAYTDVHWSALVEYVDALPETIWEGPADAAGWTVKDHVAHVVRWDEACAGLARDGIPRWKTLRISEAARSADGFDMMNEEIRQQTIGDSVETVKQRRDAGWLEVRRSIATYSDDDLRKPAAGFDLAIDPNTNLLQALVGDLGEHYDEHLGYIRAIVDGASS